MAKKGKDRIVKPVGRGTQGGIVTTGALAGKKRREFIAQSLLIYNLTQAEMVDALAEAGHVNPKTGEPWSIGTINRDVSILRQEWETNAAASYDQHVQVQLGKIHQAQAEAWSRGDLDAFARFMEQEMKLTGTAQRDMTNQNADPIADGWEVFQVLDSVRERIEERNRLLGKESGDGGDIIDGDVLDVMDGPE